MIQMYNVSKIFDNGVKAVNDVTLHIPKGDFLFLVGPSGAGKSTLSKLIFREELATRGKVLFNKKNVARYKGKEVPLLRRNIGMVFQDFRLLPKKNVFDNVGFTLQVTGKGRREIKKSVPAVLKMVGLENKSEMFPKQLSGGEQQRACIARAIVNRPPLIIADEPTGNLDPVTSRDIMSLLLDINRRGTTVIVATHAWDIVNSMRQRVVALSAGQVVRDEEKGAYDRCR
ncbi:MAG: cell division ATP-binding protein FtsE [Clostridiales bacterium]|nr:cell division ATP-binding protein FtsE [Clostridiales bacterium]MCF8022893.1 cell division ATP-binding protein FtsE [Clostridiales bacterium]